MWFAFSNDKAVREGKRTEKLIKMEKDDDRTNAWPLIGRELFPFRVKTKEMLFFVIACLVHFSRGICKEIE